MGKTPAQRIKAAIILAMFYTNLLCFIQTKNSIDPKTPLRVWRSIQSELEKDAQCACCVGTMKPKCLFEFQDKQNGKINHPTRYP